MGDREVFISQALNLINSTPGHPLAKLVDPATGKWYAASPYVPAAENNPSVQAGHILSNWAGGDRLALQDGHSNQVEGRFVENAKRAFIDRGEAVNIGGIPVDAGTAALWEAEGLITPGTVAAAAAAAGWVKGDQLSYGPADHLLDGMKGSVDRLLRAEGYLLGGLISPGLLLVGLGALLGFGRSGKDDSGKPDVTRRDSQSGQGETPGKNDGATEQPSQSPIERRLDPPAGRFRADAPAEREKDQGQSDPFGRQLIEARQGLRQAVTSAAEQASWDKARENLKSSVSKAASSREASDEPHVPREGLRRSSGWKSPWSSAPIANAAAGQAAAANAAAAAAAANAAATAASNARQTGGIPTPSYHSPGPVAPPAHVPPTVPVSPPAIPIPIPIPIPIVVQPPVVQFTDTIQPGTTTFPTR